MYLITSVFGGTLGLIFLIIWGLLCLYAIINVLRNTSVAGIGKMIWIAIILFLPIIGAVFYLFWRNVKTL